MWVPDFGPPGFGLLPELTKVKVPVLVPAVLTLVQQNGVQVDVKPS